MQHWHLGLSAIVLLLAVTPSSAAENAAPATQPASQPATQPVTMDLGNGVALMLVYVPPCPRGFLMGSPVGERGRLPGEDQHRVKLTRGFYLAETEVTQEQYQAVMGKTPSHFKGAKNPVERVSWNEAVDFCRRLSKTTGRTVRLPTEAEWEYACRAGSKGPFSGTGQLDDMGWYSGNSEDVTHPVREKQPNAFGLYDMHGNVMEWCQDWEDRYPEGTVTDPAGPAHGTSRVIRGGSWNFNFGAARAAVRGANDPDNRDEIIGFRVAIDSR